MIPAALLSEHKVPQCGEVDVLIFDHWQLHVWTVHFVEEVKALKGIAEATTAARRAIAKGMRVGRARGFRFNYSLNN